MPRRKRAGVDGRYAVLFKCPEGNFWPGWNWSRSFPSKPDAVAEARRCKEAYGFPTDVFEGATADDVYAECDRRNEAGE